MERKTFGPRDPNWVLNKHDRLHKSWIELNKAASTRPALKQWIRECFDKGRQQADMAEEWEIYKKKHPAPISAEKQRLEKIRADHENWIKNQKDNNKKA